MRLVPELKHCVLLLFTMTILKTTQAQEPALYLDNKKPIEARVEDLLSRLTLEEKVLLVHANGPFSTAGVPRLGIPDLIMDDGPLGVREEVGEHGVVLNRTDDFATAMPAALGLAATWDSGFGQGLWRGHRPGGKTARQRHHARAGGEHSAHAVVRPQF